MVRMSEEGYRMELKSVEEESERQLQSAVGLEEVERWKSKPLPQERHRHRCRGRISHLQTGET